MCQLSIRALGQPCRPHIGKRDSIYHHLLEATFETANMLEFGQKLLYTTPSGWWWWWWWWWWCIESVFQHMHRDLTR